jgi:hypothetical protein
MIYAVTPTGSRPEGMALLGEYINAQNYRGPLTWIIIDDCDPATPIPNMRDGIQVIPIRPNWRWKPGDNTQVKSMAAGLDLVPEDATLFICEDDDAYLPNYMTTMLDQTADLIGERDSRYYNVASGQWRVLRGKFHASLASTVCSGAALALLKKLCASGMKKMLDVNLWKTFDGSKVLLSEHNVIGIKGLPGRPGIGVGHRRNFGSVDIDDRLRAWAKDYADNYEIFRDAA